MFSLEENVQGGSTYHLSAGAAKVVVESVTPYVSFQAWKAAQENHYKAPLWLPDRSQRTGLSVYCSDL